MNSFTFDEIKIGEKASFTHVITDDMMKKFFEISGDNNPLHVNLEYAREKKVPILRGVWYVDILALFYISRCIFARGEMFAEKSAFGFS